MGALVVFTKVWTGILVLPLVDTPVIPAGCTLVHEILTPDVLELNVIALDVLPEQIVCSVDENNT